MSLDSNKTFHEQESNNPKSRDIWKITSQGVYWISLVMFHVVTVVILCQLCGPQAMRYSWGSKALKLRRALYEMLDGRWDCRCETWAVWNIQHFVSSSFLEYDSYLEKSIGFQDSLFLVEVRSIYTLHPFAISYFFNGKSVRFGLTKLGGNAAEQSFNGSRTVSCNSVAVLPFWGQGWKTPEVITLVLWHWLYNACYVRHIDTVSIRYTVWCMCLYVFVRFERSYHALIIFQAL